MTVAAAEVARLGAAAEVLETAAEALAATPGVTTGASGAAAAVLGAAAAKAAAAEVTPGGLGTAAGALGTVAARAAAAAAVEAEAAAAAGTWRLGFCGPTPAHRGRRGAGFR